MYYNLCFSDKDPDSDIVEQDINLFTFSDDCTQVCDEYNHHSLSVKLQFLMNRALNVIKCFCVF